MNDNFFKVLTKEQEKDFRAWARDKYNQAKKDNDLTNPLWHPVIREEFKIIALEQSRK